MKKLIVFRIGAILAVISLVFLAGCTDFYRAVDGHNTVTGSKNIETRQFDYSGFKKIEVSNAFNVEVNRGDIYGVGITLNDNLFNDLDISMSGDTLRIGMKSIVRFDSTTQRAVITLPELDELSITGACQAVVSGFQSGSNMDLSVIGASGMEINDLKAGDITINVVGASHLSGSLTMNNGTFSVTGASNIKLTGSGTKLELNVVGASHGGLADFVVGDASVMVVGASSADVEVHGTLDLNVSGVSTLTYGDSPRLGKVEVSGVSSLKRR